MISNQILWAKLGQNTTGAIVRWHSLVDHSADVAAVVESLLAPSTLRRRLAKVADVPDLDAVTCACRAVLSFLHDIGKANRGFCARVDPHLDAPDWAVPACVPIWQPSYLCLAVDHKTPYLGCARDALAWR